MSSSLCLSCDQKLDQKRDHLLLPYCGVMCRILGMAGLGWRTNPYRIIDLDSGAVLVKGPHFDLSDQAVAALQKKAQEMRLPLTNILPDSLFEPSLEPETEPEHELVGNNL